MSVNGVKMLDLLVSVIVPVFNVYPYLHEALDSVIGQTYTNLEIILIDDGSTDGSGDVCDEYAGRDSRIHVIHQSNKGLSAARNTGLDNVTGEVLAFIDSDDAYHCSFIEKMLDALKNEDADAVICRFDTQCTADHMKAASSEKTQPLIASGVYDRNDVVFSLIDHKMNVSVWNKLYRRSLWDNVRFNEGHVFEDQEVIYRIFSLSSKICVLSDVLYHQRKHPESITAVHSRKNLEDIILSYTRTESFLRANTPSLFSDEQLSAYDRMYIKSMLSLYPWAIQADGDSKREYRAGVRKQIIEFVERYGFSGSGFRVRTAYRMISKCPRLYDICYPCYKAIRNTLSKESEK